MHRWFLVIVLLMAFLVPLLQSQDGLPPGITNSQNPKDTPPTPAEAAQSFRAPPGFEVRLFAGEPHVHQPIAIAFDDRGRLWVAECYSYPTWIDPAKAPLAPGGRGAGGEGAKDRILIFEDSDADGRFDRRTVFWDRAYNLTGLVIGHGGVWACCTPHLLFIPDRNRDDVPDAEPTVVLDGWTLQARHNIYNGLMWGPDGWLYGRHGITAESQVGKPGTPPSPLTPLPQGERGEGKRVRLNCSIWRYHPTRETFEVVCHGTTNPWGLDFNEYGEAFFTNCVIGHLWQMIPGAHYERMYGQDYNPYSYELIASTSDHLHWGGGDWRLSRSGTFHSEAGGGHAHSGGMIYLGDNWPAQYRGDIFMCNLHGRRLNRDHLVRHGSGYVGKHAADLLMSDNPWFRGVAIDYGSDGSMYITDWADLGECHDHDGVHRSSGRIYRVAFGKSTPQKFDLRDKTDAELVALQMHQNDWFVRRARLLLAERAHRPSPLSPSPPGGEGKGVRGSMSKVHDALRQMFNSRKETPKKLRAMWALYVAGGLDDAWLMTHLNDADEHVRTWAVRFLCDRGEPSGVAQSRFLRMAATDPSPLVRLYLASALQRLPHDKRFGLAKNLLGHAEDAGDHYLPLMIWYGLEPTISADVNRAMHLAVVSRMPKVRQFIARRMVEPAGDDPRGLDKLINSIAAIEDAAIQDDLLLGIRKGLQGYKSMKQPADWRNAYARLDKSPRASVRESAQVLAVKFGDAKAIDSLTKLLGEAAAPAAQRLVALQALTSKHDPGLAPLLLKLVDDRQIRGPIIRALAAFPSDDVPPALVRSYRSLTTEEKQDVIATLSSRPANALAMLNAVERKEIPAQDIPVFVVRQLRDLGNSMVNARLNKLWGQVRHSSAERKQLIEKYKGQFTPDVLAKASLDNGRAVFEKTCQQCHALHGKGGKIGPDLTGSDRGNLHYVLENLIDPSALIGRDYQLTNIFTSQGRLISGIIVEETNRALTVQTANERILLPKEDVEVRQASNVSMMPEGQMDRFSFEELRDLIGYLGRK